MRETCFFHVVGPATTAQARKPTFDRYIAGVISPNSVGQSTYG
jgi:hypothetical protein